MMRIESLVLVTIVLCFNDFISAGKYLAVRNERLIAFYMRDMTLKFFSYAYKFRTNLIISLL